MKHLMLGLLLSALLGGAITSPVANAAPRPAPPAAGKYRNFRVAIYVTVYDTIRLSNPAEFARDYARVSSQLGFDKVYIESYRDGTFASDAQIAAVKAAFEAKGIATAGGVTLTAGNVGGQFGSFDYEDPKDRAACVQAVQLIARHFDELILDDFFFFNRKTDLDIAAKGKRSWTEYRLAAMHEAGQRFVIDPAEAINPRIKVVIKYPNWYEHFHGLGFDLDAGPRLFDGIYTGTETRDPDTTDQLLQQYESYEIMRYFDNIAPGRNGGGWVDTYGTRYIDRYVEQLWGTMFAKAPEITMFNWSAMADPKVVAPGERPWSGQPTSFDWNAFQASYTGGGAGPGWGRAAGTAMETMDKIVGALGKPIGIASYRPPHADGEDFLHDYLGNIGLPIELYPTYPADAQTVLLTDAAKADPDIIAKAEASLRAGHNVVVTSGFLRAMQGKGFEDLVEITDTGRVAPVSKFLGGFGAGLGEDLAKPVLFPMLEFYTNDAWPMIHGVTASKGVPIVLLNRWSAGTIYVLTIPENMGDLYNLPQPVLTRIKSFVQAGFPVRIDSPPQVALFAYDNDTFVIESYRAEAVPVTITLAGDKLRLRELDGAEVAALPAPAAGPGGGALGLGPRRGPAVAPHTDFAVTVAPHSFRVFKIER